MYANDLEECIGIKSYKLPAALGVTTLLNPMFGLKPEVVGSGLITDAQYDEARSDLFYQMQDILDEKFSHWIVQATAAILIVLMRYCLPTKT